MNISGAGKIAEFQRARVVDEEPPPLPEKTKLKKSVADRKNPCGKLSFPSSWTFSEAVGQKRIKIKEKLKATVQWH